MMNRELVLEFARVAEQAALNCAKLVGKGDKNAADGLAVEAMRRVLNELAISGTVVIGEGEMDEAPMLYIGEKVGRGGVEVDIAVDPLEGTNLAAKAINGSIAVLAVAPRGSLLHAPDMYMEKIAVGPAGKGVINIDAPVAENLANLAKASGKAVSDLTVVLLDRDRHKGIISEIRAAGARCKLISDGDVSPAVAAGFGDGVDMLMGTGGAPEGVLAAAALKCMGGDMQARLKPENDAEIERAKAMGLKDPTQVLTIDDLVKGDDVIFAAAGITDGEFLRGVRKTGNVARTHTVVMRSKTGTIRFIETLHKL